MGNTCSQSLSTSDTKKWLNITFDSIVIKVAQFASFKPVWPFELCSLVLSLVYLIENIDIYIYIILFNSYTIMVQFVWWNKKIKKKRKKKLKCEMSIEQLCTWDIVHVVQCPYFWFPEVALCKKISQLTRHWSIYVTDIDLCYFYDLFSVIMKAAYWIVIQKAVFTKHK